MQHKEVWLAQGGFCLRGQPHRCVSMSVSSVLPAHERCGHEGLITSPSVGNLAVIMPREIHASRLRSSWSELSVMYVICLVSLAIGSLHLHRNGYQVVGSHAQTREESHSTEAALAPRVGHRRQDARPRPRL